MRSALENILTLKRSNPACLAVVAAADCRSRDYWQER